MRPAFASTKQAAAFVLLILVLLLLPLIIGKRILPPREQLYSSIWWGNGAFPYIDQQIYVEKSDIDIAFVGPSHIWQGINTRYVQSELTRQLGRPAVVRSICWGGAGYDELYFITRDLLQNRKVRMLVYYDAYNELNRPNAMAAHWFRWGDDSGSLEKIPMDLQASYYFASILGMPHVMLSMVRINIPADLFSSTPNYWSIHSHADNFATNLGSMVTQVGFKFNHDTKEEPFEDYTPPLAADPADARVYSDSTKGTFAFVGGVVPSWQIEFGRKFAHEVEKNGCRLVLLHIPDLGEGRSPVIQEREFWPDALQANITMVGIPPEKLFKGLSEQEIHELFEDQVHVNKNGQDYFTRAITPALLQIYDSQVVH